MNKSETVMKLATALSKAQGELKAAQMNATNPFLKNRYADLGAIIEAAKPTLAKHGLSVSQMPTSTADRIGVTTILLHESGEWIEDTITLPLGDERGKSLAQVAGSVITYLRRYSLASVIGMYADEDVDGGAPKPQARVEQHEPTNGNGHKAAEAAPEPVQVETPKNGNGNGHTPEPQTEKISLESANGITNSKGVHYGDLDSETLSNMFNAMSRLKKMGKGTEEHDLKCDAIQVILKSRNN